MALVGLAGCDQLCQGPACEASWPGGALLLYAHDWDAEPDVLARGASATATLTGTADLGARWSVAADGGRVVAGLPESRLVVLWHPARDGDDRAGSAGVRWTGPWEGFGADVALGDLDGAGPDDLWVGAPDEQLGRGAAVLYRDARDGASTAARADLVLRGAAPGDGLGTRVTICADLTGDGRPEVLLGLPGYGGLSSEEGAAPPRAGAVLLLASEAVVEAEGELPWTAPAGTPSATALGRLWWADAPSAGLGAAASCRHDLDGDGVADVVLGAPHAGGDGAVHLLSGAALPDSGPLGTAALPSPDPLGWFGTALAVGDFDGDGQADLAVGAPGADGGHGRVRVYLAATLRAGESAPDVTFDTRGRDDTELDHIGRHLGVGDVDGDGLDDLAIGSEDWREGASYDAGRVGIWRGLDSGWSGLLRFDQDGLSTADYLVRSNRAFQRVGRRLLLHDVDGDGDADLLLPTRTRGL